MESTGTKMTWGGDVDMECKVIESSSPINSEQLEELLDVGWVLTSAVQWKDPKRATASFYWYLLREKDEQARN